MWRLLRRSLVPAVVWLACLLCTLQLLAGFASDREGELVDSTHRLRPRHVGGEPEVRGRTYQRHGAEPLDARHRDLHRERLRLNRLARPHLVARRQIFSASSSQAGASDFIGRDREDSWPNVSCTTCSLVGYSGHLLGSGLGNSVDASECVIRLGRSPGEGYHSDVGRKTTFRLLHADTLHELLKRRRRPERFARGPLASDHLVMFGTLRKATPASLRTRLESIGGGEPRLLSLRRSAEHAAAKSLAQHANTLGYQLSGAEPSTLWYAIRLAETIECQSLAVFGVPEPKVCKCRDFPASVNQLLVLFGDIATIRRAPCSGSTHPARSAWMA
ncbi:alpha-N-acetylgalactosaminide alpha-2,6-sialyltransferase 5-like isoform X3 [Amblyomma americanum]